MSKNEFEEQVNRLLESVSAGMNELHDTQSHFDTLPRAPTGQCWLRDSSAYSRAEPPPERRRHPCEHRGSSNAAAMDPEAFRAMQSLLNRSEEHADSGMAGQPTDDTFLHSSSADVLNRLISELEVSEVSNEHKSGSTCQLGSHQHVDSSVYNLMHSPTGGGTRMLFVPPLKRSARSVVSSKGGIKRGTPTICRNTNLQHVDRRQERPLEQPRNASASLGGEDQEEDVEYCYYKPVAECYRSENEQRHIQKAGNETQSNAKFDTIPSRNKKGQPDISLHDDSEIEAGYCELSGDLTTCRGQSTVRAPRAKRTSGTRRGSAITRGRPKKRALCESRIDSSSVLKDSSSVSPNVEDDALTTVGSEFWQGTGELTQTDNPDDTQSLSSCKRIKLVSAPSNRRTTLATKSYRNKLISAYPLSYTRSVTCKPVSFHRACQTEANTLHTTDLPPTAFVPLPITVPLPIPIPQASSIIPCFLPIPCFIPLFIPLGRLDVTAQGRASLDDSRTRPVSPEASVTAELPDEAGGCQGSTSPVIADCVDGQSFASFSIDACNGSDQLRSRWPMGVRLFCNWLSTAHQFNHPQDQDDQAAALKQLCSGEQCPTGAVGTTNFLSMPSNQLAVALSTFVQQLRRSDGSSYGLDAVLYVCICIHYFLVYIEHRPDMIFFDDEYMDFANALHNLLLARSHVLSIDQQGRLMSRIDEELLWTSGLLGTHHPRVLLNTMVYLNSRYFMIQGINSHLMLAFEDIIEFRKTHSSVNHGDKSRAEPSEPAGDGHQREILCLRYYAVRGEQIIFEQTENVDNPNRCAIRLYRFYLSKCPPMMNVSNPSQHRTGPFYLEPERNVSFDSPIWFTPTALSREHLERMLLRIQMVKDVNEAHLSLDALF